MQDEPLGSFLYEDVGTESSTNYISLTNFGLEFQYDLSSKEQTWHNLANWFRANEPSTIGALPSPFFEDLITLLTLRAFGEVPAQSEKKSLEIVTDDAPDRE
jgi:hypothetical protein